MKNKNMMGSGGRSDHHLHWRMELNTRDSGIWIQMRETEGVCKYGLMEACMKDTGKGTRLMEKEG